MRALSVPDLLCVCVLLTCAPCPAERVRRAVGAAAVQRSAAGPADHGARRRRREAPAPRVTAARRPLLNRAPPPHATGAGQRNWGLICRGGDPPVASPTRARAHSSPRTGCLPHRCSFHTRAPTVSASDPPDSETRSPPELRLCGVPSPPSLPARRRAAGVRSRRAASNQGAALASRCACVSLDVFNPRQDGGFAAGRPDRRRTGAPTVSMLLRRPCRAGAGVRVCTCVSRVSTCAECACLDVRRRARPARSRRRCCCCVTEISSDEIKSCAEPASEEHTEQTWDVYCIETRLWWRWKHTALSPPALTEGDP